MTDNTTPREVIERIINSTAHPMSRQIGYTQEEVWLDNPDDIADAVIAHLWQAADDPAVVDKVAKGIHAEVWKGDAYLMPWDKCRQEGYIDDARRAIPPLLTALLGPRPTEQEPEP